MRALLYLTAVSCAVSVSEQAAMAQEPPTPAAAAEAPPAPSSPPPTTAVPVAVARSPVPIAPEPPRPTAPSTRAADHTQLEVNTPRFGIARQLVLTQALGASFSHSISGISSFSYTVQPSFHYFVSSNFSLGALLFVSHESNSVQTPVLYGVSEIESRRTSLGGRIDVGYNAQVSGLVSIWLRGQVGASHQYMTFTAPLGYNLYPIFENGGGTGTFLDVGIYAPVLIHPVEHFFVGIGPSVDFHVDVSNSGSWSDFGLSSTLGGWI